ncbi:hypothetical protein EPUS_08038 [Endocarpon pusillum Z07020]|uniref:Annexin n=1 Tax=Endocarpon pusillum (strain Z07020 / HMAS-L-300199) TaxID=1263415 RepID=U1GRI6_ENDPU|nr:uncharacterized protein EPUS_08038 [Endocarpon pusillum Z07020]ERF74993.1 hypothetical protein EPUS_08038 [Endocarpon pusillum Z07020]
MLTVRDNRRGRSKSPGGRERSTSRDQRDHPRDTRATSPSRKERKKSSQKYSESESEDDRRSREKKSSKKYYESDSDDGKNKHKKSSRKYDDSESEESDRERRKSRSKKYYDSDSDTRGKSRRVEKRAPRRHDPQESESDRRKEKSKKSSRKYYESDSSEEPPRHRHTHAPEAPKDKLQDKHQHFEDGFHPSYAQPQQYMYSQPGQYMQPAPAVPPQTRHMSLGDPRQGVDPRHEQWREEWAAVPECERPGFVPPANALPTSPPFSAPGAFPMQGHTDVPDHQRIHSISSPSAVSPPIAGNYIQPPQYQYAEIDPHIKYKPKSEKTYVQNPQQNYGAPQYSQSPHPQYVEVKPGTGRGERQEKKYRQEDAPSKKELASRLGRLAISGGAGLGAGLVAGNVPHGGGDDSRPPASPLLEAYHGTYQSISPMPSPLMLGKTKPTDSDSSDLSDLDISTTKTKSSKKSSKSKDKEQDIVISHKHRPSNASTTTTGGLEIITATPRTPKRVSFYDPVPDALKIASALSGTHHAPNTRPLISILPHLSTEDMLALRAEYKNHAKASGKGINMAKHIKMRVPGNLGKATYATALGRWESEAYWANSWYQSGGSRRELLIESLMGRSNSDMREIKNCFRDKRYADDLEKCMRAELKADKFRLAILLALEENRMADSAALDPELIAHDVRDLYRALTSRDGGETAMIQIIVLRSDAHLREVLRAFEKTFHLNFAREMISKSRNLVGETLAHILNGALNRPMRDALLLHQAMAETAPGRERAELLISRAVRLHWDPRHMERVKRVYEERYRVEVGVALKREVWSSMKTIEGREWVEFVAGCLEVELDSRGGHGDKRASGGRELERERDRERGGRGERRSSGGKELDRVRERDRDRETTHGYGYDYDVEERKPRH